MSRTLRYIAIALVGMPVIGLSYFAWSQPDQFSRIFLRTGGQIVKEMADHPGRVAGFLAVSVVLLWTVIGMRCVWESWREQSHPTKDPSRTVANR